MKNILFLLLLIGNFCLAQKKQKDSGMIIQKLPSVTYGKITVDTSEHFINATNSKGITYWRSDSIYHIGDYIDTTWFVFGDLGNSHTDTFTIRIQDTVRVIMLISDTSGTFESWPHTRFMFGYSVREAHNEAEGLLDPGFCSNCVYKDYWVHLYYLDENKKPLNKNIVVWQNMETKKE